MAKRIWSTSKLDKLCESGFLQLFLIYENCFFNLSRSVCDFHATRSPLHSSHMQKSTYEYWSGFAMHLVAFSQASQWIHNKKVHFGSHTTSTMNIFSLLTKTQFYKLIKIAINSRFCISPTSHLIEMHFSVFIYLCVALARMCMKNVKLPFKK